MPEWTCSNACLAIALLLALYIVGLAVHRAFLHPLRHIPGPRLAALTQWVETYYECFKPPAGQFMWQYQKWHNEYGTHLRKPASTYR